MKREGKIVSKTRSRREDGACVLTCKSLSQRSRYLTMLSLRSRIYDKGFISGHSAVNAV
jgi:hypothetical protein